MWTGIADLSRYLGFVRIVKTDLSFVRIVTTDLNSAEICQDGSQLRKVCQGVRSHTFKIGRGVTHVYLGVVLFLFFIRPDVAGFVQNTFLSFITYLREA